MGKLLKLHNRLSPNAFLHVVLFRIEQQKAKDKCESNIFKKIQKNFEKAKEYDKNIFLRLKTYEQQTKRNNTKSQ